MRKKSEVLKARESIPGGCCERFAEYKYCNCLAEAEPDCTLVEAFQKLAEAAGGRWDGVDADKYIRELRGDLPKETFPRPPSNEQTLLTELGEAKARCETACDKVTQLSLELERAQVQRNAHCDEEDALTDLMAKQDEQIKRLRELLSDSLEYIEVNISEAKALQWWAAAEAILKESAP